MFTFLGGVPKVVVPDNSKLVVFKADRFDLGLNRTYAEMAGHSTASPSCPRGPTSPATSRSRRASRAALDSGAAAQPALFLLTHLNAAIRRLLDGL